MLRSLSLKGVYKSDEDDILSDFYFPALSSATRYDRAVGFFSASTISQAAQALSAFIAGGGRMRLIVGSFTDAADIEAISEGLRLREISETIGEHFLQALGQADDELFQHRFEALSWLAAHGRLDVKVALRAKGLFHDKVGVITDAVGDAVVFSGSANESAAALLPTRNYESINVFPAWRDELAEYHEPHRASFERLWANRSRDTAVIDLPTAVQEKLLHVGHNLTAPPDPEREAAVWAKIQQAAADEIRRQRASGPRVPDTIGGADFEIRPHQREALTAWQKVGDFVGIFDLATGAGKTITAVYAAVQMAKSIPGLTLVIAVPYQNLADQWCEILELFNIHPLQAYVSKANWLEELNRRILDVQTGLSRFEAIVVVNRTLKSPEFQAAIARIPSQQFLWVGDECHHHSSESFIGKLPANARYRIGLSATPEHYLDEARNDRLRAFYGEVVATYTLAQAIEDKVLTPYNYFPQLVELTHTEAEEFIELSDEIARAYARAGGSEGGQTSHVLTGLLMKRSRLVGAAANKVPALIGTLSGKRPESHSLFYCGDGRVLDADEDDDHDDVSEPQRQIEVVSERLDELGWRISRFTSRESRKEREKILRNFRTCLIDAMVAIKCLDEGIDVPACSTAYILASSRDPRQFIQRRGRILRRSPGKTVANIYDFVVVLPEDQRDASPAARNLVRGELKRVAEFSTLAVNRFDAYNALRDILQAYDLEHAI